MWKPDSGFAQRKHTTAGEPDGIFSNDRSRDWISEQPELRRLYMQVIGTKDRSRQQALVRQMERYTRDQAYFLFLYSPIHLYAVNKEVQFIPHPSGLLLLNGLSVTDHHWSVRQKKTAVHE